MRYTRLANFMSFNRKKVLEECDNKAPNILIYLILVLIYPNDVAKSHWIGEIIAWLDDIRNANNTKSRYNVSRDDLSARIRSRVFDSEKDVIFYLKSAISHYDKSIPRNKVNISRYNIDYLIISLDSLLSQCSDYIDSRISENELVARLMNSFLYSDELSEEELDKLSNKWKSY